MRVLCFAVVLLAAAPTAAQVRRPDVHLELIVGERYVVPEDGLGNHSVCDEGRPILLEIDREGRTVLFARRAAELESVLLIYTNGDQRRYLVTVRSPAGAPTEPEGSIGATQRARDYSAASTSSGVATCG